MMEKFHNIKKIYRQNESPRSEGVAVVVKRSKERRKSLKQHSIKILTSDILLFHLYNVKYIAQLFQLSSTEGTESL